MTEELAPLILRLETQRTQALVAKDLATAERLHAPDYQLITPGGGSFDKAGYLQAVASGELNYLDWLIESPQLRLAPTMALIRYRATLEFASGTVRCWHTDAYEWRDGQWQAVWSQATAIK
ncbi:nuclear transport factor 2 family protein [Paucibacter sp. DJ1R-11]|uniref:nuclear transport factor 2 family protein n=1 Tax=Paucibacter sp. DJ1R-11 TaxID=2893556 RepID=UPI0021E4FB79|nr:nuclear transport factor 2 family protein [Paucibacter sp. DJ1R-11]MCV2362283.1 nuclear transport factor 2 family protein [Paucibacter sp. DJ1R-11]